MKPWLLAFAALLSVTPAAADDCTLKQAASLDLVESSDGYPLVPLVVSGTTRYFYLDLAGPRSVVSSNFADELKLERKGLGVLSANLSADAIVTLPSLQIGAVNGVKVPVLMRSDAMGSSRDPRAVGFMGLDLLSNFDIELDLAHNKLKLFAHEHCPGKVVYWANEYTTAPLKFDLAKDLRIEMLLDGKPIDVLLGSANRWSAISMRVAYEDFDLDKDSPGMEAVGDPNAKPPIYKYPFKTLSAGGVIIKNPDIRVYGDRHDAICDDKMRFSGPLGFLGFRQQCFGVGLMLTNAELRQLHLYLALTEKVAYATAASAHK
jgi:hypothetical protein